MSASAKERILTLSDLEEAVRVGNVQMAQHAFDSSNQGVGDVPRLEMLIPKLESLKEVPGKESHIDEVDSLIERIQGRIDYLKQKG